MTPAGIEPATFRNVAQHLNHCAPMPSYISKSTKMTNNLLTYPSERLVETVSASVSVLEGMVAEVAHTCSVEEKITAANKNTVDFG